jgi:hypothetical protein
MRRCRMATKFNGHQKYYTKSGILVPGVTTVLSILAKPALVPWANKLGLQGIKVSDYVDNLADVGTLAHRIIEAYLKNEEVDFSDYTPNQRTMAENSSKKFFDWEKQNDFKVIKSELQLVSEKNFFGGTCDIYASLNGKKTLIDIKTSKNCYAEHFTQCAGYKILLEENGYPVEDAKILRIGREESEGFDIKDIPMIDVHAEKFLACLRILQIDNKLKEKKL